MNSNNLDSAFNGREQENTSMTEPEYFRAIGRLEAQVQTLTTAITELKTKVEGMDTKLADLDRMANRWKGGFAVVLALGAIAGVLLDYLIRFLTLRN
jgi:predicted RNase H-like nuclease (RuvC/YqgF family)